MPTTRNRVHIASDAEVRLVAETEPTPLPDEAVVELAVSGICGTDISAHAGRHPWVPLPYYPGHEAVGRVLQAPAGSGLVPGALVTVIPTLWCGQCKNCRRGATNTCEQLQFFGTGYREGGMADRFHIRPEYLFQVPEGLDAMQAALIEPLATPLHAIKQAGGVEGRAVAVIGAGTIGRLLAAAAKHLGAAKVVSADLDPAKLELAKALGVDATVLSGEGDLAEQARAALGESADVVFDCVCAPSTVRDAVKMADRGGTVMAVGVPHGPVEVDLPLIQDHQIELRGSITYLREDFAAAADLIAQGLATPEGFISAAFPLSQAGLAFAAAAAPGQLKVVVTGEQEA